MVSCVFPGSFDPVTVGHIHLISRAAGMFDQITVAVMINIKKAGALSVNQRIDLLRKACSSLKNVRIVSWDGLLTDFMQKNGEKIIIRGIRNGVELDQEINAHYANRMLYDQLETIFLPADPNFTGISSSAVREIAFFGGNIEPFVPVGLSKEINDLLSNKEKNNKKG